MIKKIAIIAFTILPTVIYAADNTGLFVKASGALLWPDSFNSKNQIQGDSILSKVKLKAKKSSAISLELGYNVTEDFRMGLELSHMQTISLKGRSKYFINNTQPANILGRRVTTTVAGSIDEQHKAKIDSLLLNAYFDIYDLDFVKLFINACGGVSHIQEKLVRLQGTVDLEKTTTRSTLAGRRSSKETESIAINKSTGIGTRISPAGGAGAGCSIKLTDRFYLESTYNFRVLGKAKGTKILYSGHYANFGIRFNI